MGNHFGDGTGFLVGPFDFAEFSGFFGRDIDD